jgi:CubicO group peptidase (beta-lactamase class C family)
MMLRRTAVFLLLLTVCAAAQTAIPNTPPGRLLQSWLESFNSGDADRHTKFLTEHSSDAMRHGRPSEQVAENEMRFRNIVGGGFDVYKVVQSSDTELRAVLKERGGFGWAEIVLRVDPAKPDVIVARDIMQAPPPPEARPEREDAPALARDLQKLLDNLAGDDRFAGVVLVAKDGKPIFQQAWGFADRDKKITNNLDTRFRLGSMNKMFTSVAIAQLVQQGKVKYTDTVAHLLPDYPDKGAAAKITVHQLLTHTSGLGDFFGDEFDKKKDELHGLKDYLQLFAGKPLQFEPGQKFAYSNAGMIVAGLIVERISGQNYYDYVREHIYKPAGMNGSDTFEKSKPQPNQSVGYTRTDGKWASNYDSLPLMGSSAGGGDSTAPDLLKFDQALRSHKLLNADLTSTITTAKVTPPDQDEKYAYGFEESMVDGKRVIGHGGGAPGMNANLDMYWDSGYTVIVLCNLDPPIAGQVNRYIRDRIRQ